MRILGAAAIVAIVSIGVLSVAHSDLRRDRAAHRSAAEPEPPRFDPSTADADGLAPRRVMGYRKGRPRAIEVITIGWAEVEVRTAQQFLRMREAAAADGVELIIRSGYRSHERQAWLYQAWRAGYGNRAARPGYSRHQDGRALDLELYDPTVHPWLKKHARRFGFKATVAREPWHWELVRVPKQPRAKLRPRG